MDWRKGNISEEGNYPRVVCNLLEEMAAYDTLPPDLKALYDALPAKFSAKEFLTLLNNLSIRGFNAPSFVASQIIIARVKSLFPSWQYPEPKRAARHQSKMYGHGL